MKKMKELYLSSMRELASPKNLALCGVMGALSMVLGIVASIQIGPYIKIGFSGLPNRIVECLFGPVIGCIFGGTMDILWKMCVRCAMLLRLRPTRAAASPPTGICNVWD